MNRFTRFTHRWLLFIGLFAVASLLTIQHDANGQGDKEVGFRFRLSEVRRDTPPTPTPAITAPPSSPIPPDATQTLINRSPPSPTIPDAKEHFAIRDR